PHYLRWMKSGGCAAPGDTRNGALAVNAPIRAIRTRPPMREPGKISAFAVSVPSGLLVTVAAGSGNPPSRVSGSAHVRVMARPGGNFAPVETVTVPGRPTPGLISMVGVAPA